MANHNANDARSRIVNARNGSLQSDSSLEYLEALLNNVRDWLQAIECAIRAKTLELVKRCECGHNHNSGYCDYRDSDGVPCDCAKYITRNPAQTFGDDESCEIHY